MSSAATATSASRQPVTGFWGWAWPVLYDHSLLLVKRQAEREREREREREGGQSEGGREGSERGKS